MNKMDEKNAWELKHFPISYNKIDDIVNAILNGEITSFDVKERYVPGDSIDNYLEKNANSKNYIINYTDENHYCIVCNNGLFSSVINPTFFEKHKEEILKAFNERVRQSNDTYFRVQGNLYTRELLNILLNKKDIESITFVDVELTEEEIKIINDKHIDAYLETNHEKRQISSRYIFDSYTYENIANEKKVFIKYSSFDQVTAEKMQFLTSGTIISLTDFGVLDDNLIDEEYRLLKIRELLDRIELGDKNVTVKIVVKKRSVYKKVFGDKKYQNIDLIIVNDKYDYSYEEYMAEEKILDDLVRPINERNFSPFEKYIAVYNIAKMYKKYNENESNKDASRYLRYILFNDYMVCVGFAHFLRELCDRVGINCNEIGVSVDVSYDMGYTQEDKSVERAEHQRNIVSIDDDKYNIHGLYMADATWDNDVQISLLNNALMTFDKTDVSKRMFFYSTREPILDIHNFQEFNTQVNYLLKHKYRLFDEDAVTKNEPVYKKMLMSYRGISDDILSTISCDPRYVEFEKMRRACKKEVDYVYFLTELGQYLLTRINKKVESDVILKASLLTDKELENISGDLAEHTEKVEKNYNLRDIPSFPYEMDRVDDHYLKGRSK